MRLCRRCNTHGKKKPTSARVAPAVKNGLALNDGESQVTGVMVPPVAPLNRTTPLHRSLGARPTAPERPFPERKRPSSDLAPPGTSNIQLQTIGRSVRSLYSE